ncbi:MAG TPA: SUMF1/EgtB/PvdO family nonheme iron enzyme [Ktedonobacterales bacterium]|nr:SUMF1/EgtB/PvdO family nonheme iron enzyme [Ktedonobacterales bacterium]
MPDDGPSGRGRRRRGGAWYHRIGAALDAYFFPFGAAKRRRARMERERALLVPPPVSERFPQRLANLGFVRHGDAAREGMDYITPPLCHVEAGPFLMGSGPQEDADAKDDERPQHTVETESYQIAAYPVTVAEYDCAVRAGVVREPSYLLVTWNYQLQRLDFPIACISWADATAYAAWLARLTGQAWRLPTEAEWEKAARGTDGRRYPWGNPWDSSRANVDKIDAWYLDHEQQGTGKRRPSFFREWGRHPERFEDEPTPVGAFAERGDASPCGAHELAGNVWEWTSSLYRPYPYSPGDGREDSAAMGTHVLRGGSWGNPASDARAANRNGNAPAEPDDGMGFRLVLADGPGSY